MVDEGTVVEAVALLTSSPVIQDCLPRRLSVDEDDHGVFLARIEVPGLIISASITTPFPMSSVKNSVGRAIHAFNFSRSAALSSSTRTVRCAGSSISSNTGGVSEGRVMYGWQNGRRVRNPVRSGLILRRHPLSVFSGIQAHAREILLGAVVG